MTFTGFQSFAQWALDASGAHFFLHPSQTSEDGNVEGIPNSMLEAMATGMPVAATLHSGIPEAFDDNDAGILVPEKDDAALASRLLEIMKEPERYRQMSARARATVEERFDHARQIAVLEGYYEEAIELRKAKNA